MSVKKAIFQSRHETFISPVKKHLIKPSWCERLELPIKPEDIINFFYLLYQAVRDVIQYIFESTIMKVDPSLAAKYADATTILITITAILIIFEVFTAAKKILRIIVILGWVLLILSIAIGVIMH